MGRTAWNTQARTMTCLTVLSGCGSTPGPDHYNSGVYWAPSPGLSMGPLTHISPYPSSCRARPPSAGLAHLTGEMRKGRAIRQKSRVKVFKGCVPHTRDHCTASYNLRNTPTHSFFSVWKRNLLGPVIQGKTALGK